MERLELTILRNLLYSENYSRKVIPFIQPDYFEQRSEKVIFQEIVHFIVKYNASITKEALAIELDNRTDFTETEVFILRSVFTQLKRDVYHDIFIIV